MQKLTWLNLNQRLSIFNSHPAIVQIFLPKAIANYCELGEGLCVNTFSVCKVENTDEGNSG